MQHDETAVSDTEVGQDDGPAKPSELVEVAPSHYEIRNELARGGMGRILVARDRRIGRTVALKELLGSGEAITRRFEREALVTGRLQHPAIVPVYEAGRWPSGEPFYAMKLVAGTSLDKVIAEKSTFAQRLGLLPNVIQICEAMAYAHGERVIHRDLKPANVLVGKFGETVVVDWGLAKGLDEAELAVPDGPYRTSGDLTVAGSVMGTPMYMPPEQAQGDSVDERADVYALGAMLYHVLTGGPPYRGTSADSILEQVMSGPPPAVATLVASVPDELAAIVGKAMARDVGARYPTAKELADELVRFQAGQLVSAHAYSTWDLVRRFVKRHRAAVLATAAIVVLGGAIAAIAVRSVVAARDAARAERASSLEDQGRRELYAGQPTRAAAFLSEAYRTAPPTDVLRVMLAQAVRPVDASVARIAASVHAIAVTGEGFATLEDDVVRLWTWDGAAARTVAYPHAEAVAWDGDRIVTASGTRPVAVWSARGATVELEGSQGVAQIAARDGIVYGAAEREVDAWDATTGKQVGQLAASSAASIALSTDGKRVVIATDDAFYTADTRTLANAHRAAVKPLAVTGDRAIVATDAAIGVYDLATGGAVAAPEVAVEPMLVAGFGGSSFVTIRESDQLVRLHDATTGAVRAVFGEGARAAIARDGSRLVIQGDATTLWVYDDRGDLVERLYGGGREIEHVAIAADGAHVVASDDTGLRIWRVAPSLAHRIGKGQLDEGAARGERIVASDGAQAVITNVRTGAIEHAITASDTLVAATFSPDGTRIATATQHGRVDVWDASSGASIASFATLAITVRFSPDGARLVTSGEDDAYVWDARTGARLATLVATDRIVTSARFSPDGARVVIADEDSIARIYDAATGALQRELHGHGAYLTDATFSPDGTRVLTASGDGTAKIWDARTGAPLVALSGHTATVDGAVYSHDGRRVLTFEATGAHLWDAATGALLVAMPGAATSADFVGETGMIVVASTTGATLWTASGPMFEIPAGKLPNAPVAITVATAHAPRQHASHVASAPDGAWLALARDSIVLVPLPRETRDALPGGTWRVQDGALVPVPEAGAPAVHREPARVKTYDFAAEVVQATPRTPKATSDDARYAQAWQQHAAGDDAAAYRTLVPIATTDAIRDEALWFGASGGVPIDELLARHAPAALARAYDELGDFAHEAQVLHTIGDAPSHLALARIAFADAATRVGTTELLAALALSTGDDAIAAVDATATAMATSFLRTHDERYLLAARRLFAASLAKRPDPKLRAASDAFEEGFPMTTGVRADFDKGLIRTAVRARLAGVQHCYEVALGRDATLAGTVDVRIRILEGRVVEVTAKDVPQVAPCIAQVLRAVALPDAPGSGVVLVNYPVVLKAL